MRNAAAGIPSLGRVKQRQSRCDLGVTKRPAGDLAGTENTLRKPTGSLQRGKASYFAIERLGEGAADSIG
jgi:hypothetical protein